MISFVVPSDPLPTARPRVVRTKVGGMRAYTPKESAAYQNVVAFYARRAMALRGRGVFPVRDPVRVRVVFYRANHRRVDLDNLTKSVLDGLTKAGAWGDDSQVVELHASKAVSDEPRAEVRLEWSGAPLVNVMEDAG